LELNFLRRDTLAEQLDFLREKIRPDAGRALLQIIRHVGEIKGGLTARHA